MKSYIQKHNKIKYSDNWSTPLEIYDHYIKELGYYDPCKLYDDSTNVLDPLKYPYNMFINPPYSNIEMWVDFSIELANNNNTIVLLIPSRTDTKYFHKLLNHGCDLEFIKGRLKFGNMKNAAPFPSVLVHLYKGGNIL